MVAADRGAKNRAKVNQDLLQAVALIQYSRKRSPVRPLLEVNATLR
jgi:hypothetical protein